MEQIEIPKLDSLLKECKWLEPYYWYCRVLQEHVAVAGKIDGVSVPHFVLKSISRSRKSSTFVSPDMKAIISGIADVACIVGAEDVNKPQRQMPSQTEKIFSIEEKTRLRVSTRQLQAAVQDYEKLIPRLRKQQKKCWNLSKTAAQRQAAMENTVRNGEVARKPYQDFLVSYEELLKQLTVFMDLQNEAETIKGLMIELNSAIKQLVVTAIENRTNTAITILTRITQDTDTCLPTKHILESLQGIDANRFAHQIFSGTAERFYYPNIQNYRSYPGFTLGIPNSKHTKPVMVKLEKICAMDGCHLIRGSTEETLPGFMETKKDLKVKLNLKLMDGKIGYGWTRKTTFSLQKTWGLFNLQ